MTTGEVYNKETIYQIKNLLCMKDIWQLKFPMILIKILAYPWGA